jgi:hypothetical protein
VAASHPSGALRCLLLALFCGCAELHFERVSYERPFRFEADTLAFANELVWSYRPGRDGSWRSESREPAPGYTHECFVLARSARQFFQHARFEPAAPAPDDAALRALVRRVVATSPRVRIEEGERVVIPGYASLRELSRERGPLLQRELGGAIWSYVQRGNWRLPIPVTRRHQASTARRILEALAKNRPPILHLIRFPHVTINHAVLVFGAAESETGIRFWLYDPNTPEQPMPLDYDRATRTFLLPRNHYFEGGRVDAYEIYHRPWY